MNGTWSTYLIKPTPTTPHEFKDLGEDGEITIEMRGKNLCPDISTWTLSNGAYRENGYIVFPESNSSASVSIPWNYNSNYLYISFISYTETAENYFHFTLNYYNDNNTSLESNGCAIKMPTLNQDVVSAGRTMGGLNIYGTAISNSTRILLGFTRSTSYAKYEYKIKDVLVTGTPHTYATDYEPYVEPTTTKINITGHEPLRKVDNVSDYIDYANKQIVRNIGKYEFTGNETINANSSNDFNLFYCNPFSNWKFESGIISPSLCNYFGSNSFDAGNLILGKYAKMVYLYFSNATTVANIKAWMQEQYAIGKPVTVYYQLAEPICESIQLPELTDSSIKHIVQVYDATIKASEVEVLI